MDSGEVSAGHIKYPNDTQSSSSTLKRKRATATDWFPTKRRNRRSSVSPSNPPLQAFTHTQEHTETGSMASTYRSREVDPHARSPIEDGYNVSYDNREGASSRGYSSKVRDGGARQAERSGSALSNQRNFIDDTDGRPFRQEFDRYHRVREAEEYKKGFDRRLPTGPRSASYHSTSKSENQHWNKYSRKPSTEAATSPNPTSQHGVPDTADTPAQLSTVLARFVSDITQQASLQIRRDAAKNNLDRAIAEFEKGHQHHGTFKSIGEVQKANLDKAQREFDEVEKGLREKIGASVTLVGDLAACIASNSGGTDGPTIAHIDSKVSDLTEKFTRNRQEWNSIKNQQKVIDKECHSSQSAIAIVEEKTSSLATKLEEVKDKDIVEVRKTVDKLSSRMNDFPSQLIQMSKEIDDMKDRSNELKALDKSVSEQLREISDLRTQIYGDIENPENSGLKHALSKIEDDHQKFRQALGTLENLVAEFTEKDPSAVELRLQVIEDRLATLDKSPSKGVTALDGPLSTMLENIQSAQKDLRVRIDGLQEAQDSADDIMGTAIQELRTKSRGLESSVESLKEQHSQEATRISSELFGLKTDISAAQGTAAVAAINFTNNVDVANLAADIKSLRSNLEGVILGLANLDSRMNNLTTEHLARQILGQLDEHVRGAESRLQKLEGRLQMVESRGQEPPITIPYPLRAEIDALSSSLQVVQGDMNGSKSDLVEHLGNLSERVGKVEASLETLSGTVQHIQTPLVVTGSELTTLPPMPSNEPKMTGRKRGSGRLETNGQKRKRQSGIFIESDSDSADNRFSARRDNN